ncbi:uncharacterized protein L969DRAFT_96922 [Mixia osmundae IAM 14324]|uniref:Uncharacterized protein n=1 Tax=Mixia osmundae (strain CBS 9802 / IAM 14324 / JCM 22182 / KY 12970) TaxID=764103 RepID=G7E2H5_MIXOS|nr:uncharacterized protein L969DRAFT_96922 [Mixia osmundae IAM 14324]KEI36907.1 hypothetical protein L969DRAFT_96922 [Mixia osmundae IAM 14324]GAA97035.1 hypothetical protein E5Q_03710 [Mixia osmundae IAM 14324]
MHVTDISFMEAQGAFCNERLPDCRQAFATVVRPSTSVHWSSLSCLPRASQEEEGMRPARSDGKKLRK